MDIEEFEDLVDRLGDDLSKWPEAAREVGERLLANSPAAREIMEEAALVRQAFSQGRAEPAPAGLADRIVLRAMAHRAPPRPAREPLKGRFAFPTPSLAFSFRPAVLLPLCFVVGLALSLFPIWRSGTATQIEVPTLFQACCGDWSTARNE
jgi:hypothetical protein